MTRIIPKQLRTKAWEGRTETMSLSLNLAELPRLSELLVASDNQAEVSFQLYKDALGWSVLEGRIEASVEMLCQRCFNPMGLPLTCSFKLALIEEDAAARNLPKYYEPLIAENGLINTRDVIEDEILLALPIVPMHKPEECSAPVSELTIEKAEVADSFTKPNPFSALAKLKEKGSA